MVSVTEKDCYFIMEKRLRVSNFDVVSFALKPFSEIMGFHGSHALLMIVVKVGGNEKEYSFFVKTATKSQLVFDEYFAPMRFFYKEHVIMTKLMDELQAQITRKLTAKCYLSKLDKFIVMENLTEAGYEVIRGKQLDLAHAKIAVETFADFHATSFILQDKGTKLDEKYPEVIYETFFVSFPDRERYLLKSCEQGVTKIAAKLTSVASNVQEQVFAKVSNRLEELSKPSKKYKNVMCQGDPWGNNVMYRYQGDVPKEGIMVDFQSARFVPPALEITQFLYVATTKSFRKEYGNTLIDAYYKRLARTLEEAGVDINCYLPRNEFTESCAYYKEFGVAAHLYYTYVTSVPGQYLRPAVEDEKVFLDFMIGGDATIPTEALKDETFKEGLVDAINDAIEFFTATA